MPVKQPSSTTHNELSKRQPRDTNLSRAAGRLATAFGMPNAAEGDLSSPHVTRLPVPRPGELLVVSGPSGSGKTTALIALESRIRRAVRLERVPVHTSQAAVAQLSRICAKPDETSDRCVARAAHLLTLCGLSEPRTWFVPFDRLSAGEQFRMRLAMTVANLSPNRGGCTGTRSLPVVIIDEFGENLHRELAETIACNLRKLVTRCRLRAAVATNRLECLAYLRPDHDIRLPTVESPAPPGTSRSAVQDVNWAEQTFAITRAGKKDYRAFAVHHYRSTDELGFVDSMYLLLDRRQNRAIAFVAYAHSPLNLVLRNRATDGRYVNDHVALNNEFRILRRLIVHPDYRGRGLGHRLVRSTMRRFGTRYVECLSTFGHFNPVFEKAGMIRLGTCPRSRRIGRAVAALQDHQVNAADRCFAGQIASRPEIRRIVQKQVEAWYASGTGGGRHRPMRQSPERLAMLFRSLLGLPPVYYLWSRRQKDRADILCHVDGTENETVGIDRDATAET